MAAWESAPKSAACFSAMTLIMTSEMNCEEGERKKEKKKKKQKGLSGFIFRISRLKNRLQSLEISPG